MRSFFLIVFLIGSSYFTVAQALVSESEDNRLFTQASEAYRLGSYGLASQLFSDYLRDYSVFVPEAQYYQAASLVKMGKEHGLDKLDDFVMTNPQHPLMGQANFLMGQHWFDKGNYLKALDYFEATPVSQLTFEESETLKFNMGYAYYMSEDIAKATPYFSEITKYKGFYYEDASYYLANIYYQQQAYRKALELLEGTAKGGKIEGRSVILMANILFQIEDYKQLFSLANDQLTKSVNSANKALNQLCGEAYYQSKSFDKAAEHFQRFVDLSGNRADAETFYKLGFSYYQLNNLDKAIDNFKKAGLSKGSIGEVSSFYLGQLYLKKGNVNYAYSAFKTVTEGKEEGNESIREESAFLIGKINFERALFDEAILDFNQFKITFPKSRWTTEANELVAQAYLKTSNYTQAIEHLESIVNKTTLLKSAYQKVTLQQAQLLFNDAKFEAAIGFLDKSISFPVDKTLAAQGYFLKGECHSLLNAYPKAAAAYGQSIRSGIAPWNLESNYALGYVLYNEKSFEKAQFRFERYLQLAPPTHQFRNDALLRLADCYYVTKQYQKSLESYDLVEPKEDQYVYFQKGLIYSLTNDLNKAAESFQSVIASGETGYTVKAYFQLGELQLEKADFAEAAKVFEQLVQTYPENDLVPYAKSEQALAYLNINSLVEAKANYVYILDNHLNHPVANGALLGLQEVIKKGEQVEGFDEYMAAYSAANPDDSSVEVIAFEAAKTAYYQQDFPQAVAKLQEFMSKYSSSAFYQDAQYFLADAHYRSGEWQNAASGFLKVAESGNSAYGSRALDKRGKALTKLGQYQEAIENYYLLKRSASTSKERYMANEGLMTSFYASNQYDSSLAIINTLLSSDWKPANAASNIWLIKSKMLIAQGDTGQALDELIKVINDIQNENAAEAKYLIGQLYFDQSAYKNSLEVLFSLNKSFASYRFWVGKSFILIASNYLELDELLQARATLESVIENTDYEEIKEEALVLLATIKAEEEVILTADTILTDSIK